MEKNLKDTFVSKFSKNINIPKNICSHMLNEKHTYTHRMSVGASIMLVGVLVVQAFSTVETYFLHVLSEVIGYGLHGLGLTPFIDYITKIFRNNG
jgi:hypothetical protein